MIISSPSLYLTIFGAMAALSAQTGETAAEPLLSASFGWQSPIAAKPNKTVEDYFLLLPMSFLDCENVSHRFPTMESRMQLIGKKDTRNGYLGFFKTAQIAVFKNRADKTDYIAVQIGKSGAGSTCGGINTLLQFDSARKMWKKREDLFPKGYTFEELYEKYSEDESFPYFDLPQKGLEVRIKEESKDSVLFTLKWNGTKFVVIK